MSGIILPALVVGIETALVAAAVVIIRALIRRPAPRGRHHAPAGTRAGQRDWWRYYDEADRAVGLCGWIADDGQHCHYPIDHPSAHQPVMHCAVPGHRRETDGSCYDCNYLTAMRDFAVKS